MSTKESTSEEESRPNLRTNSSKTPKGKEYQEMIMKKKNRKKNVKKGENRLTEDEEEKAEQNLERTLAKDNEHQDSDIESDMEDEDAEIPREEEAERLREKEDARLSEEEAVIIREDEIKMQETVGNQMQHNILEMIQLLFTKQTEAQNTQLEAINELKRDIKSEMVNQIALFKENMRNMKEEFDNKYYDVNKKIEQNRENIDELNRKIVVDLRQNKELLREEMSERYQQLEQSQKDEIKNEIITMGKKVQTAVSDNIQEELQRSWKEQHLIKENLAKHENRLNASEKKLENEANERLHQIQCFKEELEELKCNNKNVRNTSTSPIYVNCMGNNNLSYIVPPKFG